MSHIHLMKLCVGAESVEDLSGWQAERIARGERLCHVTRMWPKEAARVTAGGSLYWVIKGLVTVRQQILALDEVTGADGTRRCGIVLDPALIRVEPVQRRPFQGWRYLQPEDAPRDLATAGKTRKAEALPPALAAALAEIGVR